MDPKSLYLPIEEEMQNFLKNAEKSEPYFTRSFPTPSSDLQ